MGSINFHSSILGGGLHHQPSVRRKFYQEVFVAVIFENGMASSWSVASQGRVACQRQDGKQR
jgi:hypothetical protein